MILATLNPAVMFQGHMKKWMNLQDWKDSIYRPKGYPLNHEGIEQKMGSIKCTYMTRVDTQSHISKKSPTGPTERTPKPEYLIVLATYLGVRW